MQKPACETYGGFPKRAILADSNGPVAQLGARFHGMEEVVSSNLTRSTKLNLNKTNTYDFGMSASMLRERSPESRVESNCGLRA